MTRWSAIAALRSRSPAAQVLRAIDTIAFRRVDLVVADTEAHAAFFRRAFDLPGERVEVALVGADEALFGPPITLRHRSMPCSSAS